MLVLSTHYPLRLFCSHSCSYQSNKAPKQNAAKDTFGYQFAGIDIVCLADLTTECKPEFCYSLHIIQCEGQIVPDVKPVRLNGNALKHARAGFRNA